MGKQKGMPKTGGRRAGTPNKVTGNLREFVSDLIDSNRDKIAEDIDKLQPKDRVMIFEKLMSYVMPKKSETSMEITEPLEIVLVPSGHAPVSRESEIDLEKDPRYCIR